jgi:hypothetical protein
MNSASTTHRFFALAKTRLSLDVPQELTDPRVVPRIDDPDGDPEVVGAIAAMESMRAAAVLVPVIARAEPLSAHTHNINPNQTLILGDGHLTVGMVGPPANDSVMLNVNGKSQTVAAGQTLSITPDPATQCLIYVQSFDVFKAVVVATCAAAKAQ